MISLTRLYGRERQPWGLLTVLALALLMPAASYGQLLQGGIDGNITDSTQAAIVGAKVVVVNSATNVSRETITNEAGIPGNTGDSYALHITDG